MDTGSNRDHGNQELSPAEYRSRLLTKLNCLVAVLEVAIAKVSRSMEMPGANQERLVKIRSNLENTLSICSRAKQTLETAIAKAPSPRAITGGDGRRKMTYRDYVELTSIDEYKKFKQLPPIRPGDVSGTDLDDLISRLSGG